jgi:crossover junction endodeoxyribonuclease RusA
MKMRLRSAQAVVGAVFSSHRRPAEGPSAARAEELSLTLPIPPSINHQYATVNGRRLLSAHGRSYKALVGQEVMMALSRTSSRRAILEAFRTEELALCIRFFFTSRLRRDVDGGLKIAQDALCQGLGINDNRIVETHLYKHVDKAAPRMEIRLCVAAKG